VSGVEWSCPGRDCRRHGYRRQAPRDGFTACPEPGMAGPRRPARSAWAKASAEHGSALRGGGGDLDAGDAAAVATGPADVARQVDRVVAGAGQRLPAAVRKQVDTVGPDRDAARLCRADAGRAGTVAVRIGQARHLQAAIFAWD